MDPLAQQFLADLGLEFFEEAPSIYVEITKTHHYITTVEEFQEAVRQIAIYRVKDPNARLAVDVETYRLDGIDEVPRPIRRLDGTYQGYIRTIQIGLDPRIEDKQFIIDVKAIGKEIVGPALKHLLETATVIGQWLKYEYQFLIVHLGIDLKKMRDTCLINQVLLAGDKVQHNLTELYGAYLDYGWFKDFTGMTFKDYKIFKHEMQNAKWDGELTERQLRYAADDVRIIHHLYEAQLAALDKWKKEYEGKFQSGRSIINVIKMECRGIPAFSMMELRGIHLDKVHHQKAMDLLVEARNASQLEINKHFVNRVKKFNYWCPLLDSKKNPITDQRVDWVRPGPNRQIWYEDEPINVNSTPQLHEHLEPALGFKLHDTEEATLKLLINKHPAMRWILQNRKAKGLLSKFGQKLLDMSVDSVIYPNWNQIGKDDNGIVTGRSSASGPNMMQILGRGKLFQYVWWDKELGQEVEISKGIDAKDLFRSSFVAPDGYCLIDYDYSQIEPRIAAELCEDPELLQEFAKRDSDVYALTAMAAFELDKVPVKGTYDRDAAKIIFLGQSYGMGPAKLCRKMLVDTWGRVDWTDEERWGKDYPKLVIDRYYHKFIGIKRTMDEVARQVCQLPNAWGTLAVFKGRKPFAVAFTAMGRPRRFCLTQEQEDMPDEVLHRGFKIVREDGSFSNWNEFARRLNESSRQAANFRIQGTAADVLKIAVVMIHNKLRESGRFDYFTEGIIGVIHDEILLRVREENKTLAHSIVQECMMAAGRTVLKRVLCKVEGGEGRSWSSAKGELYVIDSKGVIKQPMAA